MARVAETALIELSDRLGWMPQTPIHIVVSDDTDGANGFARNSPYNIIGVNAVAPREIGDLSHYDDYIYALVVHELTHIVHIDTILGLPGAFNTLFGKQLTPNGAQPAWFVEGLATYFESALTGSGRIFSPLFKAYLRTAALADELLELDEITGFPWRWPQGSTRYLYGGFFLDFIARQHGEEVLREVSYDYGGRFIPYAVNSTVRNATGRDYPELYADFKAELRGEAEAVRQAVEEAGRREGVLLTTHGQDVGAPRIAGDGTVYAVESPVGEHARLLALAPDGVQRSVGRILGGSQIALHPDGVRGVASQVEVHAQYRFYGDLFELDLDSGATRQLTAGARAREPDISPDGRSIIFAQNLADRSVLVQADFDDLTSSEVLTDLGPATQIFSPRFSPNGERVVFAAFADHRRDILRFDVDTGAVTRLTDDRANDGGPVFSRDGAWVYFHSDRDGVFNLFAVPSEGGSVRRVTRVVGGAFHPEPSADDRSLVYRHLGARGFDLARVTLPPGEPGPVAEPVPAEPDGGENIALPAQVQAYPARDYRARDTVLPRAWLPTSGLDSRGSTYGAAVYGEDAVGLHSYTAQAWYGVTSGFVGGAVSYVNRQFHPGLFLHLNRSLGFALVPYVRNGRAFGVEEEIWSGSVGTFLSLWNRRERNVGLSAVYEMTYRRGTRALRFEPLDNTPLFPDDGRFGALRLTLSYGDSRAYLGSISSEEGTRAELSLRLEDPYLGSEYSAVSARVSITQFWRVPYHPRHVVAVNARVAAGDTSYRRRRLYGIGGVPKRDLVLDLLNIQLASAEGLRGFPQAPFFVGDAIAVGHIEYRLPLVDIESGIQTLPFYVRTLHAAMFVDGAAVADRLEDLGHDRHFSIGGELRLGLVVGYALPATVRLGWGHGLGDDDVSSVFLLFGSTF